MQGLITQAHHRILGERIVPGAGDIVFCPGYWHDSEASVYEGMRARGVDVVLLLHDILPVTRAEFNPSPWRESLRNAWCGRWISPAISIAFRARPEPSSKGSRLPTERRSAPVSRRTVLSDPPLPSAHLVTLAADRPAAPG